MALTSRALRTGCVVPVVGEIPSLPTRTSLTRLRRTRAYHLYTSSLIDLSIMSNSAYEHLSNDSILLYHPASGIQSDLHFASIIGTNYDDFHNHSIILTTLLTNFKLIIVEPISHSELGYPRTAAFTSLPSSSFTCHIFPLLTCHTILCSS